MCGALLPTGNTADEVAGCRVTLIDNGMPVVVLLAADVGIRGDETREELEANSALKARLEEIRLAAGPLMNLGDVRDKTRSEEHTSELQSLMRISYAVFCLKKKTPKTH